MSDEYILAIDQGTTSSRAMVFDQQGEIVQVAQQEFPQIYPADGWVEHDPEEIWSTALSVSRQALAAAEADGGRVVAIGVTNQRETTILWDRETGVPVHNAIVWQDRRTAEICERMDAEGLETEIQSRTGLLLDPYFSATKLAWILNNVEGARRQADSGDLAFGTVDSFLIWRLTGGRSHATDATNASRTSLFNIHTQEWDGELLRHFDVPAGVLPEVRDCASNYGETDAALFGRPIPILGVAGDQQAAAFGQCCFDVGSIKSTYGTGCFVLMNTGPQAPVSRHRLLSTVAYRLDGRVSYALEGSIFIAGAAVQWLRDGLGIISHAAETEALAASLRDNAGVYLVPAFTGLGAPHWKPGVRGAILGLTRASGRAELARAALEAVCYQTSDLFNAMADEGVMPVGLKVDGGMVANDWLVQFLSDLLDLPVERPKIMETTALGAAYLAGLQAGMFASTADLAGRWQSAARFEPILAAEERDRLLRGWHRAVEQLVSSAHV